LTALCTLTGLLLKGLRGLCGPACTLEIILTGVTLLAGAERTLRPFERLLDVLEAFADRALSAVDLLRISAAADQRLRQANHLGQLVVADLVRGFGELARRFALVTAGGARRTVQIGLERLDALLERAFPFVDVSSCLLTAGTRRQLAHRILDLALLARELVGLLPGLLDIALGPLRLIAFETALCPAKFFGRRGRFGLRAGITGCRTAKRIRGALRRLLRLPQFRSLLFA